jgi:hypothetical protein
MSVLRRTALAGAGLIAAASFTGGMTATASAATQSVRPYTFVAYETGYGSTEAIAQRNAGTEMLEDYSGCSVPYVLVGDGQEASGTWWATVGSNCTGVR